MYVVDVERTGENIRQIMKQRGMTGKAMSKMTGITEPLISRWVNGKSLPNTESLVTLSDVLNVKIDDILIVEDR